MDEGLLDNANCGGENVHRGAVLGAMLGAHNGADAVASKFARQLADKEALATEIDAFADSVLGAVAASGGGGGGKGEGSGAASGSGQGRGACNFNGEV